MLFTVLNLALFQSNTRRQSLFDHLSFNVDGKANCFSICIKCLLQIEYGTSQILGSLI